jgi:hypothetical protein
MRKQPSIGVSVGASSILVIFVMLCLTTFATLSLVSANRDFILSQKTAESTTLYYSADSLAEARLAEIDQILQDAQAASNNRSSYLALCKEALAAESGVEVFDRAGGEEGNLQLGYTVPAGESAELQVRLQVLYPPQDGARYQKLNWSTHSTIEWEGDSSADLWDGDFSLELIEME